MAVDEHDIARIREIFEDVFVLRRECETNMKVENERIDKLNIQFAVIEQRLKTIIWFLTAIGSAVIAALVKLYMGG